MEWDEWGLWGERVTRTALQVVKVYVLFECK